MSPSERPASRDPRHSTAGLQLGVRDSFTESCGKLSLYLWRIGNGGPTAVMVLGRPLQTLSVRRITRVIEAHWDEPQVLAGILHDLRFRLEPEAAFQARSIARRLSTLQYRLSHDAARIAEESQAAAAALAAATAIPDEPPAQAAPPRRRRRAAVIA